MKGRREPSSVLEASELDALLTANEAADLLCVKAQTLAKWRMGVGGYGPVFIKVGRSIRYRRKAILAFIETNTFNNTVEARYRPRPSLHHP